MIGKLMAWLGQSFTTLNKGGLSARKATAFVCVVLYIGCHVYYYKAVSMATNTIQGNWATAIFTYVLQIDIIACAFFLGLIDITQLLALRAGREAQAEKQKDDGTI